MGLRGPPPKPTAIRRLEGNPSNRPLNEFEPMPQVLRKVDPPDNLPPGGELIWNALAPELIRLGLLTEIDLHAFTRYVRFLTEYYDAEKKIDGKLVIAIRYPDSDKVKYFQQNPYISIRNNAAAQLNRLEQQFGLTPSARARMIGLLQGGGGTPDDPYGD